MRILINLKSKEDYSQEHYYHEIQGFLYSLVRDTELDDLHNVMNTKFFSFSNIFPIGDIKKGDRRKLIIATPDIEIYEHFINSLTTLKGSDIRIGKYNLILESCDYLTPKLRPGDIIETATPIIIRLSKEYDEEFWQPKKYKGELFFKQLETNLRKKYNLFFNQKEDGVFDIERDLGNKYYKRTVIPHVRKQHRTFTVLGTTWSFTISRYISNEALNFLDFAFESGFGEMNSMGFGFMNRRLNKR